MDPSRKIPSNMKRKMRGSNSKMLQYRWNGSFQLQILQITRKTDRTEEAKKSPKREKHGENNSGPILIWYIYIVSGKVTPMKPGTPVPVRLAPWCCFHWFPQFARGCFKALLCETVLVSKSWAYCLWCLWRSHWQTRLASCLGNLPAGSDPNVQPQSWQWTMFAMGLEFG